MANTATVQPRLTRLADVSGDALAAADYAAKIAQRVVTRVRRMAQSGRAILSLELAGIISDASRVLQDYDRGFVPNPFIVMRIDNWCQSYDADNRAA